MTPLKAPRYPRGYISTYNINIIQSRNPWVTAWWSAAIPGLGHIILGKFIKGFILVFLEIFINLQANLNSAIMYSFTGRFNMAKEVLDQQWLLLYVSVYIFSIWDSYRVNEDSNKISTLASSEDSPLAVVKINSLEFNSLGSKNPWLALVWSAFMPGLGHLCNHKLFTGVFLLVFWIAAAYYSHLTETVSLSLHGAFRQAAVTADPAWLLFLPSIYGFSIYNSYASTVELNRLFQSEQSRLMRNLYQCPKFKMPV